MSEHMSQRHIKAQDYIQITIQVPGRKQIHHHLPNDKATKESLYQFLDQLEDVSSDQTCEEAKLWEDVAKDRISRHTKAGLALRGARFREDLSQKALAELVEISQENISRMENGKRPIGVKTAKKLAVALKADYRVFLSSSSKKSPPKKGSRLKKNQK